MAEADLEWQDTNNSKILKAVGVKTGDGQFPVRALLAHKPSNKPWAPQQITFIETGQIRSV